MFLGELGKFGAVLGYLGMFLGGFQGLRVIWVHLAHFKPFLGHFGEFLGHLRSVWKRGGFRAAGGILGHFQGDLGHFKEFWGVWGHFRAFHAHFRPILGHFGPVSGPF